MTYFINNYNNAYIRNDYYCRLKKILCKFNNELLTQRNGWNYQSNLTRF